MPTWSRIKPGVRRLQRRLPTAYGRANQARKALAVVPARLAFETASSHMQYLAPEMLPQLQARFRAPDTTDYSPQVRTQIGRSRADALLAELGRPVRTVLELGCGDGRVCGALSSSGIPSTGIDSRPDLFDPAAVEAGASLVEMDAHSLAFPAGAFDAVISHGAFEHFTDPEAVLEEAVRVLAPGGRLSLSFGPLYLAPKGLHAYRSLNFPYCQVLFRRAVLDDYVAKLGARPIAWETLNGWSVSRFRRLFRDFDTRLDVVSYEERRDVSGRALIRRYPGCFRSKSTEIDDFLVASIRALFRKR